MTQINAVAVNRKLSSMTAATMARLLDADAAGTLEALFEAWGFYTAPAPTKARAPRAPRGRTMTMSAAMMDRMVRQFQSAESVSLAA